MVWTSKKKWMKYGIPYNQSDGTNSKKRQNKEDDRTRGYTHQRIGWSQRLPFSLFFY